VHALYFGEGMAGNKSRSALAKPRAKKRWATANDGRVTREAHEQETSSCTCSTDTKRRTELPSFYALADLASGRAVLDPRLCATLRGAPSTCSLASSRLA